MEVVRMVVLIAALLAGVPQAATSAEVACEPRRPPAIELYEDGSLRVGCGRRVVLKLNVPW